MTTLARVQPLRLADGVVADPPVVLAPMAGITNTAFRRLCREAMRPALDAAVDGVGRDGVGRDGAGGADGAEGAGGAGGAGGADGADGADGVDGAGGAGGVDGAEGAGASRAGGLFVSEMITTRALVERNPKTVRMVRFEPDEQPRSIQLYGVDPQVVGAAVRMIVEDDLADHVDLNFGCPVPKVTRRGGGSALPWRIELFDDIVTSAVRAAQGAVPVTVKMRVGIDAEHVTYREAGLRAQDAGVAEVALHGRTAAQFYGGQADWDAIADLVELLDIPVLGNGDIWEADDAVRMVEHTGCAGVVVGRGCLGRPWLFADLAAAFDGRPQRALPRLAEVAGVMRRHAELLEQYLGPHRGVVDFRKHVAWYLKGFTVGSDLRGAMASASSLGELDDLLARLDDQPYPEDVLGKPRGRTTGVRAVALPYGWLDTRGGHEVPEGAELPDSGG